MGVLVLRMASICGITLLIDELVHNTTMSGLAAFSAFFESPATMTPSRFLKPTTSPRSRPSLAGSMSIAPTILNPGRWAICLTIAAPIGPSPKCITRMLGIAANYTCCTMRKMPDNASYRGKREDLNEQHPGNLTREHVVWAYRLLLDRDPESEDVIGPKLAGSRDTRELRNHLITSAEFRDKNRDYAHTNDRTIVIKEIGAGDGCVRLFVDLSDHVIGLNIVRGAYERDEVTYARHFLRPGDTALDLGAHVGFFAVQMAAMVGPAGRVYAFEPFDANAELLERSIVENRFEGRLSVRRAAVGAASGSATLTFPVETLNSGGAYLLREGTAPLTGNLEKQVPVVALDDIELPHPVRFIKMDVEGAEPQVLDGAKRLMKHDRPVILSELHPTQLQRSSGVTGDEFLAQVRGFGYRAHDLCGQPIDRAPADAIVSIALVPVG